MTKHIKTPGKGSNYISTTNACKLCKPMGATLAFRGIEGAMPFLHGSQGCATYMRRYIISHFNEPMDIASSSLGEKNAIFGGGPNLKEGLKNVTAKFYPQLIGIATTCLTETIGDDLPMILHEYKSSTADDGSQPLLVPVSTPSYSGTHMEGFHAAVRAVINALADKTTDIKAGGINILPGFVSPADIRHLKEIALDCTIKATILPDISETLDGPALAESELIPHGGTPIADIKEMAHATATLEFGSTIADELSGGVLLSEKFSVPCHKLPVPIGISASDQFFSTITTLTKSPTPAKYLEERGRLIDSLADGHKYIFGKKAVVYGEEDLVVALTAFLTEIGIKPVLCASGGKSGKLKTAIQTACKNALDEETEIHEGTDFYEMAELVAGLSPDLLIGHSKGYQLARKLQIPIIRVGFPIHDRLGGQRILHIGYRGAQNLFDTLVNAVLTKKQDDSPVGYSYM